MSEDEPDLFEALGAEPPKPDATKVFEREKRQRPKTGAPLVVATYIETYTEVHGRPPLQTVRGKLGREARAKLSTGHATEEELVESVRRMAHTEYENMDVELRKLRQERQRHNEHIGAKPQQWAEGPTMTEDEYRAKLAAQGVSTRRTG